MNSFFQSLLNNSPVLIALFALFYMIKQQGFKLKQLDMKMEQGFRNVENEFKLVRSEMREGFLKVNLQLKQHDREIRSVRKKLKSNDKTA